MEFRKIYASKPFSKFSINVKTNERDSPQKEGSGEGLVLSDPLGISCGSDCTEVIFNGTLVTLTATALSDSVFTGWMNCPLPNGNECFITVTQSATIRAVFQPDDLIFSNGFE